MPKPKSAPILPESILEFRQLLARSSADERRVIAKAVESHYTDYRLNLTTEGRAPATAAKRIYEQRLLELLRKPIVHDGDMDWVQVDAMSRLVAMRFASAPGALRPFLRARSPKVRVWAADYFSWIGKDAILPSVLRLIRSKDARIAKAAIVGAGRAVVYRWASAKFRRAILRELVPLVTGRRRVPRNEAGNGLLNSAVGRYADLEQAKKSLLNRKECLHAGNHALPNVLFKLVVLRRDKPNEFSLPDAGLLWSLHDAVMVGRTATLPSGTHGTLAAILNLTADLDPARTQSECKTLLKQCEGEPQVFASIQSAMRRCRSIPEAHHCLMWMYEHPGRLSPSAERTLRAFELASFVLDEGFPAYFYDCGEHWRVAHAGLELVGEAKAAAIVTRGAKVLARTGPPADAKRARALGLSLSPSQEARLEKIGKEYARVGDGVIAAVERYIASHVRDFAAVMS